MKIGVLPKGIYEDWVNGKCCYNFRSKFVYASSNYFSDEKLINLFLFKDFNRMYEGFCSTTYYDSNGDELVAFCGYRQEPEPKPEFKYNELIYNELKYYIDNNADYLKRTNKYSRNTLKSNALIKLASEYGMPLITDDNSRIYKYCEMAKEYGMNVEIMRTGEFKLRGGNAKKIIIDDTLHFPEYELDKFLLYLAQKRIGYVGLYYKHN